MTVSESARAERICMSGARCEATGMHHPDCPGEMTTGNAHRFVLHHICRRQDKHAPIYEHRDDVEHLRLVFNGPTSLGAAGCHGRIHSNQTDARALGLLVEKQMADILPFRTRDVPLAEVEDTRNGNITLIPVSLLDHLTEHARILTNPNGAA